MKRSIVIAGIAVVFVALGGYYATQLPRFRAEEQALAQIATVCGGSIKYVCIEGLPGIQYVNVIWLPQTELSEKHLTELGPLFDKLPRLNDVIIGETVIATESRDTLWSRYPNIGFNSNIGFSRKPKYRFAHPMARQPDATNGRIDFAAGIGGLVASNTQRFWNHCQLWGGGEISQSACLSHCVLRIM